ncbi:MAG TPA: hypothetical protein PKA09_22100 [Geminicoccus sp.]|nr:hypothetical protein [Geminicoccus sp.]
MAVGAVQQDRALLAEIAAQARGQGLRQRKVERGRVLEVGRLEMQQEAIARVGEVLVQPQVGEAAAAKGQAISMATAKPSRNAAAR